MFGLFIPQPDSQIGIEKERPLVMHVNSNYNLIFLSF